MIAIRRHGPSDGGWRESVDGRDLMLELQQVEQNVTGLDQEGIVLGRVFLFLAVVGLQQRVAVLQRT